MAKPAVLKGKDIVVFVRKLSEAKQKDGYLIPYQTDGDFDQSKDSDSTATKSGNVATIGAPQTDFSIKVLDSEDPVLDLLEDSYYNDTVLEFWRVKLGKKNEGGKYFAHYMQGTISEDSQSASSDDNGEREFTVSVNGTPKRGYTEIPAGTQAQLDYLYKGVMKQADANTDNGGGEAMTETATPTIPA